MTAPLNSVFTPMAAELPPNVTADTVRTLNADLADDHVATLTGKDKSELAAIAAEARSHGIPLSIVVVPGNPGHDSSLRDLATEVGKTQHGTVVVFSDDWVGTYSDTISRVRLEWAEDAAKGTQGKSGEAASIFAGRLETPESMSWTAITCVLLAGTVAVIAGLYWVKARRGASDTEPERVAVDREATEQRSPEARTH
ncbi:Rv1476 family membrane protein [Nocardia beijingensis]|uniref:Rv1476 family membrane protein n=1 Tax=Nocardia beijingensis TaxID=95162 RepID=UPI0033F04E65